jgi:hypothetical protein
LNIGQPLEESGILRLASTVPNLQPPFQGAPSPGEERSQLEALAQQLNALAVQFNSTPTQIGVGAAGYNNLVRQGGGRDQLNGPAGLNGISRQPSAAFRNQLNALASSPTPPATINENTLAIWEYANLNPDERRAARMARGSCTYCGLGGHFCSTCPNRPQHIRSQGLNTLSQQETGAGNEYFHINSEGVPYPNTSGMVQQ